MSHLQLVQKEKETTSPDVKKNIYIKTGTQTMSLNRVHFTGCF